MLPFKCYHVYVHILLVCYHAEARESKLQRPTILPNIRQRAISSSYSDPVAEDICDVEILKEDEFESNYVSLSEIKEYNLIAR